LRLFSYWRSSAAYRVRIGLHLKGLPYELAPVHLLRDGGEQHTPEFRASNPQGLVPVLEHGQRMLRQSMAILEYLDEVWPTPPLLPATARDRQRVRALAQVVACDVHPLNNLRVLQYLSRTLSIEEPKRDEWYRHWVQEGFRAIESRLAERGSGAYCLGETPTLADICLVPQVANANRLNVDMAPYPRIGAINATCLAHPAFAAAHPDRQPDAE
jgi:maleylacetoacetate isomerase